MNQDPVADPADRPLMPPELDSGMGALRWVITGIALVLLVVGAWRGYMWFIDDVAKRRAVASGSALQSSSADAPPADPTALPPPITVPRTVQAPAAQKAASGARAAGQVAGLEGVNKCVVDGQVTYTNTPCPAGSTPEPRSSGMAEADTEEPAGVDANGVSGSTGDNGPAVRVARPAVFTASGHDPSQQTSLCGYWSAEIERLDFEFQQPLPPPVLDQISTHLASLRGQYTEAKCGPAPKSAQAKASAPAQPAARKKAVPKPPPAAVVEEKSTD